MVKRIMVLLTCFASFVSRGDELLVERLRQSGQIGKLHPDLIETLARLSPVDEIPVWIRLRDRPPYSVSDLPARGYLPPVDDQYIDAVRSIAGARFLGVSELTNEVSVLLPANSLLEAVALPFAIHIEESPVLELESGNGIESHPDYSAYQAVSYNAIQARPLQDSTWGGYYWDDTGANRPRRISVLDSGIWPYHPGFWTSEKLLPTSFGDTTHRPPISIAARDSWVHLLPKRSNNLRQLYYMRSSDYGVVWDTARVIAEVDENSGIEDFKIGAASDGTGDHVVVIYLRAWADEAGPKRTLYGLISNDNGATWNPQVELYVTPSWDPPTFYLYFDHIALAVTTSGGTAWAYAAWSERRFTSPPKGTPTTAQGLVKLRRSNSLSTNTWMGTQTVFDETKPPFCVGDVCYNYSYSFRELDASAESATAHIVFSRWFDRTDGLDSDSKVFLYTGSGDGATWTQSLAIVRSSTGETIKSSFPSVATKEGFGHVAFWEDTLVYYTRHPSPPASPLSLSVTGKVFEVPGITVTRDTGALGTYRRIVHVVWYDNRDGKISIRYKRHPNNGDAGVAWDDGDTNPANDNEDISKKMSFDYGMTFWKPTLDMAGTDETGSRVSMVHIAWRETRSVNNKKYPWYANSSKIYAWKDFIANVPKPREPGGNDHGTEVSSVAAGAVIDRTSANANYNPFMGTAYNTVLAVASYDGSTTPLFEASIINGVKWAVDTIYADVLNTSLGYPNNQATADSGSLRVTQYVDWGVARGLIVSKSAGNRGNSGASTITPPGDNFNALTVGGSLRSGGTMMPISSLGPLSDGRIKPDIVAPGGDGNSVHHNNTPVGGPGGDIYTGDPDPNSAAVRMYDWWEGTSFAAPHVAGLSAMLLRSHPTWTPGAVRKALAATAAAVTGAARPNNNEGWGLAQGHAANVFNPSPFPPSILPTAVDFQDSANASGVVQLRILVKPNGGVDSVIARLAAFGVAGNLTLTDSGTVAGGWHVFKSNYVIPPGTAGGMKHIRVTAYRTGAGAHDTVRAYINLHHPEIPIPIQLASFTATIISGGRVLLEWVTISEINNYGFEVQRKESMQAEFTTLPGSFIPGHGTTLEPQYYSFLDSTVSPGRWNYRLKQIDLDGTVHLTHSIEVDLLVDVTQSDLPVEFALYQNYPNPFNPETEIRYSVPRSEVRSSRQSSDGLTSGAVHVTLKLYDVLGREVATLVDDMIEPGAHSVRWNATGFASGVYFYRLESGTNIATKKLVVLR